MDCTICQGKSKLEERDCVECGGTGWKPFDREPDNHCQDCGRALWYGGRSPKWYEHATLGTALCDWCIKKVMTVKLPRRRGVQREQTIKASDRYL